MLTITMATTLSSTKTSPSQRVLLSSDINEEDFLLNFDQLTELYCDNNDRFFLEVFESKNIFPQAIEWISTACSIGDLDPYFDIITHSNHTGSTPAREFNRYAYRSSVSRTATITKRRIEESMPPPCLTPMANEKFGTITKRLMNPDYSVTQSAGPINRTFDIVQNNTFDKSRSSINRNGFSPYAVNGNYRSTPVLMNDLAQEININTNTITKNRRSFVVRPAPSRSDASETSDCITIATQSDATSTDYDEIESTGHVDNNKFCQSKNGTFTKDGSSDTDDSMASTVSARNYPTIPRNVSKTLIKADASRGKPEYSRSRGRAANSNDDLLTSDSSEMSTQSNLSMTSSISGRSEPNLFGLPNGLIMNGQSKLCRPSVIPNQNGQARIVKPVFANGPTARKVMASKLPNSMNGFGGSVGSLSQSNIGRSSSQTLLTMASEMSSDVDQCIYLNSDDAEQKLLNGITRNSTFRVHRQQPIINVANVFSQQQSISKTRNIKSNSDDNILLTDDRFVEPEMKAFRAKVLNSNGYGIRVRGDTMLGNSRSHSPSSNSSCSSTSSMSKIPSFGSAMSQYPRNGTIVRGLHSRPSIPQLNNNNNSNPNTLNDNLNNNTTTGANRTGSNPNIKAGSRIPALPKMLTLSPNRSNIPVSGIPQTVVGFSNEHSRTLVRKGKSVCQEPLSTNSQFGDKSWQTDCF